MAESYTDKTCVVTGAGSGIGQALVTALLAEGATVYALDVRADRLEKLAAEASEGAALHTAEVDISNRESMAAVAERIHSEAGQVDLLINNAGVTLLAETADVSFADWRRLLDINYLGVLHGVHYFYPAMVKRGGGHIANVASVAGSAGYATAQAYATSKAAVIGFTRSLEVEARTHGVYVTNVCPSYVDSAIFDDALSTGWNAERVRATFLTKPVTPELAAEKILAGLRRKRKMIVFPFTGRFLHWLSRWCPIPIGGLQRSLLKKYRAARPE